MTDHLSNASTRDLILADQYYKAIRYAYDVDDLIYTGKHPDHDAATTDTNWAIWKQTWTTGKLTLIQGPLIGSWDNRAGLGW